MAGDQRFGFNTSGNNEFYKSIGSITLRYKRMLVRDTMRILSLIAF